MTYIDSIFLFYQLNKSHKDVTYKDFQELSREQLKAFFNYMIDHIDIRELYIEDDPKVYLTITIHLKLNGYAPKYSIEYLRNINTREKQKASHSKNDLPNGGGEGPQPNQGAKFNPTIHYVPYEIVMERTKEYLEK